VDNASPDGDLPMARKRAEEPKVPTTKSELKYVRLQLPRDIHKQFRILAVQQDTDMANLARKIVEEYVARHTLKGGSK
jgi:hypothetical protein